MEILCVNSFFLPNKKDKDLKQLLQIYVDGHTLYISVIFIIITAQSKGEEMENREAKFLYTVEIKLVLM